jgi:hypothetical protein
METEIFSALTALLVGVGLAAACGFRVFVPLLVASIAAKGGHITLAPAFQWIASWPALIAFSAATALEIAAYYIPWVDNLLDTIATPAAVVAGTLITASAVQGSSPLLRWSLAVIVGGGAAAVVQAGTATVRALSTATTGGVANAGVSTAEAGFSVGLAFLAVFAPFVAAALIVVFLFLTLRFVFRRIRKGRPRDVEAVA